MIIYHASKEIVEKPEIRVMKYTKDFSWGFYCTNILDQAVRWANRGDGVPYVNMYEYTENKNLKCLKFDTMTDEWLDFVALCRSGVKYSYDIVEGPMADDTIWNYVNDYLAGRITKKQFWVLAEFKYPTHQISFNTDKGLECIQYIRSEIIYDRQRDR